MTVMESPLFHQWDLLQSEVVPPLLAAEEEHGSPQVWSIGSVADAVAVTVAYQYAAEQSGSDPSLWTYASGAGAGMRTLGFSFSDIRGVPASRRSTAFRRHEERWVPGEGVAERVVMSSPQCAVDLLVVRGDEKSRTFGGDEMAKVRVGGRLFFIDQPCRDLGEHGFRRVGSGGQIWQKQCQRKISGRAESAAVEVAPADTLALRQYQSDLVNSHLRLARSLARRFSRHGESKDDLEQVALLALVKAARRFEPDRETCFSTYATASILGEIKRHFRDKTWMMRVPRSIQETYLAVKESRESLTHKLGSSPTVQQIAEQIGVSDERVLEAMEAGENYWPESLDVGVFEGESSRDIPVVDASFEQAIERQQLQDILPRLDHREQLILKRLYFDGWTQRMVAEEIGVSQMQVSRLLVVTIAKLRSWAGVEEDK